MAVLGLWLASSISLMADQWRGLRDVPSPHPEVPAADPRPSLDLLEGCRRHLRAGDTLAVIVPSDGDIVQLFLVYRLAYLLYPVAVVTQDYTGDAAEEGAAKLEERAPTHLLILSTHEPKVAGTTLVSALGPDARLYRTSRARR